MAVASPHGMADVSTATRDHTRELFLRVAESCDLPPLPAVAARAMSLARDPDACATDLARVVMTDTALAARVLKISRSVTYLRREPPRTIQEAIVVVGFHALRKILVAASARSAYSADDEIAERLWHHALATALAADEIAIAAGEPRGGDAFIAGLLHDVGKLVFHLSDSAAFATVGEADEDAECRVFGVTHASVGGCLAEKWGLEPAVIDAVTLHHTPDSGVLAARIADADRIAHQIGFASIGGSLPAAPPPAAAPDDETAAAEVADRVAASFDRERALFE